MVSRIINKYNAAKSELWFSFLFSNFFYPKDKKIILMYHGVDLISSTQFNYRFCGVNCFEKQIRFLKNNFNVISVKDFFEGRNNRKKNSIAITFDDGYLNNYELAVPILEKYNVPATFYITSIRSEGFEYLWPDFVDIHAQLLTGDILIMGECFYKRSVDNRYYSRNTGASLKATMKKNGFDYKIATIEAFKKFKIDFNKNADLFIYWKLMTEECIKSISESSLFDIGSHSHYHNNLANIPFNDACQELTISKRYLENIIQKPVESIAYPDGSYTRNLIEAAETMGFKYQLAVNYLFPEDVEDKRILSRKGVYSDTTCANQLYNIFC